MPFKVSCCFFTFCWTVYPFFSVLLWEAIMSLTWCDVFTVLNYHALYVCSCLPIFWNTSINCITTQKSEDLIYTAVEAWNLITLSCNSSQCNPLPCWPKCCWRFTFPTFVFLFLHLHHLILRHIRFNHWMSYSEVCVSHVEQDGYHRIYILEMIHPLSTYPRHLRLC